jgi:hypothetical protein
MSGYWITITGPDGIDRYDLHSLPVAGTHAHMLSVTELFKELKTMDLPVTAYMGHTELLLTLAKHRARLKKAEEEAAERATRQAEERRAADAEALFRTTGTHTL